MNLKYDQFLFSEVLYKYIIKNDKELKNELYDRMNFCGFNKKIIESFINLEKTIINYRNLSFNEPLYNKFYWLYKKRKIFNNDYNELFMINSDIITKKTLSFSECLCYLDEATYISILYKNNINNIFLDEVNLFCENINNKFIRKELTYRFMLCYDKIKEDDSEMPDYLFECINKFIDNELRIINLCKWIYPNDKQNGIKIQWKPYTKEYYKYYE